MRALLGALAILGTVGLAWIGGLMFRVSIPALGGPFADGILVIPACLLVAYLAVLVFALALAAVVSGPTESSLGIAIGAGAAPIEAWFIYARLRRSTAPR